MKVEENQVSEADETNWNCAEEEEGVNCSNETVRRRDDRQDEGLAEGGVEEEKQATGGVLE